MAWPSMFLTASRAAADADGQLSNRHLDARLAAVEDKLSLKADIKAASVSADDKLGAVRFPGESLLPRFCQCRGYAFSD